MSIMFFSLQQNLFEVLSYILFLIFFFLLKTLFKQILASTISLEIS